MKLNDKELKKYVKEIMPSRIKKTSETDHIIHGYMLYRCKSCGKVYVMNLEKGLEDPTDDVKTDFSSTYYKDPQKKCEETYVTYFDEMLDPGNLEDQTPDSNEHAEKIGDLFL